MSRIAIIGAGAAGLFAAKKLTERDGVSVHIFEKSAKAGTKLRASGGGKANIFNDNITPQHYNCPALMEGLLAHVSSRVIRDEFEKMGLCLRTDEEGRVYPATFFSATVVDVLLSQLQGMAVIHYEEAVEQLTQEKGKWRINSRDERFDKVILASGSPAGIIAKSRTGHNRYLEALHLHCREGVPSLVGFKLKHYPRFLFGCRAKAEVSLWQEHRLIHKEYGEITFKEDGISGIVILNCSAFYNRLPHHQNCVLTLDFLYDMPNFDIQKHLKSHGSLNGVLHPLLCRYYQQHPFDLRAMRWEIDGVYDWEYAQVCHGGIDTAELGEHFELKSHPGLYAIGEMVDIDGVCGGYNLFFAFASAYWAVAGIR